MFPSTQTLIEVEKIVFVQMVAVNVFIPQITTHETAPEG